MLVDEVVLGRPSERASRSRHHDSANGDVSEVSHENRGLTRHIAGLQQPARIRFGNVRRVRDVIGLNCRAAFAAGIVDRRHSELLRAARRDHDLSRLDFDRHDLPFVRHGELGSRFDPASQSLIARAARFDLPSAAMRDRRRSLQQQQTGLRIGQRHAPPLPLFQQSIVIGLSVKPEEA